MKTYFFLIIVCLAICSTGSIYSCKKNSGTPKNSGSFTEEFEDVYALTHIPTGKWVTKDFSSDHSSLWEQGQYGTDKGGSYGFPAYSYTDSMDEYAFSPKYYNSSISSWLITPVLSVKNGDKISFYTRAADLNLGERMQVLMNKSTSTDVGNSIDSVGSFTTVLLNIPNDGAEYGYPTAWTAYEYTFSDISGTIDTRIAFRHYVVGPTDLGTYIGVAIDAFKFQAY